MLPLCAEPTATNKGGAPVGNKNALKHGAYAERPLTLGKAPRGLERPIADTRRMMTGIRAAIVQAHGSTTVYDESVIEECGQWEAHRRLTWRLLTMQAGTLTAEQQAALSREAARAATERSRCFRLLGLDERDDDLQRIYGVLDAPLSPNDVEAAQARVAETWPDRPPEDPDAPDGPQRDDSRIPARADGSTGQDVASTDPRIDREAGQTVPDVATVKHGDVASIATEGGAA